MIGYKIFLGFERLLMLLPHSFRQAFFSSLGTLGYYLSGRYKKVAYQNLEFVFDRKLSQTEMDAIVKYSFKNLALNFLHLMEIRHMSKNEIAKRVKVENMDVIKKIHDEGRPIVYATTHYSSWELGGAAISAFIEPIVAVYKRMKNSTYQEWVLDSRERFGNISLEKSNVIRPLIKHLKEGIGCGILIDTNISHKEGVIVDFLGKPLRQTSTPAYLARKFNAAIVPVTIRTDDDENYTLVIYDEIKVNKTDDEAKDILEATQAQATWLGELITKEPKFWFWLHRRFKNDHPQIYKK